MSAMSTVFKGLAMSAAPEVDAMTLRGAQSTRQDAVSVAQLEALAPNEESSIFVEVRGAFSDTGPQVTIPAGFKPQVTITQKEEGKEAKEFGFNIGLSSEIRIQVYCVNQQKKWVSEGKACGYFVESDEPTRKELQKFLWSPINTIGEHEFKVDEHQAPAVWKCLEQVEQGGAKFSKEGEGLVHLTTADEQVVIIDLEKETLKFEAEH